MQTPTGDGLRPATEEEKRFAIKPLYNTNESMVQAGRRTPPHPDLPRRLSLSPWTPPPLAPLSLSPHLHPANGCLVQGLEAMWATKTPLEAFTTLSKPDVTVTNKNDKDEQVHMPCQRIPVLSSMHLSYAHTDASSTIVHGVASVSSASCPRSCSLTSACGPWNHSHGWRRDLASDAH